MVPPFAANIRTVLDPTFFSGGFRSILEIEFVYSLTINSYALFRSEAFAPNLLLIRNHDVDCFFPFIQIEKKENVEKYMRIQRINHSINKEVYYKITLENGDIIIVWDDGKMRRIHCIDVNRHIRYFIQKITLFLF